MRIGGPVAVLLGGAAVAVTFWALRVGLTSTWDPTERQGPSGLVQSDGQPRLWLTTKREEHRQVLPPGRTNAFTDMVSETRYHFELRCHDVKTTQRLWMQTLRILTDSDGGHSAETRILGRDGDTVWLFVYDQPVALSSKDGSVLADRAALEQRNPALQGFLPKELEFYAFDGGLVVIAADARRYVLRAPDYAAVPYASDEERFRTIHHMSTIWNGGYNTKDFTVRQAMVDGHWLGLYSEREAADAGNDQFGTRLKDPTTVFEEGPLVRRAMWTAHIIQTRQFSEGSHDRLSDLARVPDVADFLAGGFLVRTGTRQPLALTDPPGMMVLHRTRVDAEGRLVLTRLDHQLHQTWSTTLPFVELHSRWEWPDRLLMLGSVSVTENGATRWTEHLVSVDLHDGGMRTLNLAREDADPPVEAGSG